MSSSYDLLNSLMPYFQMMAVVNLGLIFIDRKSGVVRLQNMIFEYIQGKAKSKLHHAGELTKVCRKDVCLKKKNGEIMIALAETIRSEKDAFADKTEEERVSLFLPTLGLMAGLSGLCYLLLIPFYVTSGNESLLYILEYISESSFLASLVTIATIEFKNAFPTRISVFIAGLEWFILPLSLCLVAWGIGFTISCFSIGVYITLFITLQLLPSLFLIARFVYVSYKRFRRVHRITEYSKELEKLLKK